MTLPLADQPSRQTRFRRQVPWEHSEHGPLHTAVWQFLATASLVFGAWYIWWRWTESLNTEALWLSLPLAVAESMAYLGLWFLTYNLWTPKSPCRGLLPRQIGDTVEHHFDPYRAISVDVFFATYTEPPEMVARGLRDAKRLRYPYPLDIHIHVLDDGNRPAMAAVAAREGVNYITRPDNIGFKGGNLNNALAGTWGDFVVICDADTQLFPDFLTETLGYFRDPRTAWVQTPQWFWDIPPGVPLRVRMARRFGATGAWFGRRAEHVLGPFDLGQDPFGNDAQLFYDFIQHRRNRANASFCCGAASIHRREALMEASVRAWAQEVKSAGRRRTRHDPPEPADLAARLDEALLVDFTPIKHHVSEDLYTSITLHSDSVRRWKSVMHPKVVSRMTSPSDIRSWVVQRYKYASGTLDILVRDNPFLKKGLSLPQKLMYGMTFYSYLSPLWNVVFIVAPIIFLLTGVAPLATYSQDFLIRLIPFLVLNELAQLVGLWGVSVLRGRQWHMAMFPLTLGALWNVLRGRRPSFPVTPKGRATRRYLRFAAWQMGLIALNVVALFWGWGRYMAGAEGYTLSAIVTNTLWSFNNMWALLIIVRAAFWRPDPEFDLPAMTRFDHGPA